MTTIANTAWNGKLSIKGQGDIDIKVVFYEKDKEKEYQYGTISFIEKDTTYYTSYQQRGKLLYITANGDSEKYWGEWVFNNLYKEKIILLSIEDNEKYPSRKIVLTPM